MLALNFHIQGTDCLYAFYGCNNIDFFKTEEFWELKIHAKGMHLTEFC